MKFLALIPLVLSLNANAGFLTGMMVGSALTNGGSKPPSSQSLLVASDVNDVVVCTPQSSRFPNSCYHSDILRKIETECIEKVKTDYSPCRSLEVTPQMYIESMGYKHILKRAVVIENGSIFHVFEVKK